MQIERRRVAGSETYNSKRTKQSTHHAVDLQLQPEVTGDAVDLDEVGEVQTAAHHGVVGRQHLGEDHLGTVLQQQDEVTCCRVCTKYREITKQF